MTMTADQDIEFNAYRGMNLIETECKRALNDLSDLKSIVDTLQESKNLQSGSNMLFDQKIQSALK